MGLKVIGTKTEYMEYKFSNKGQRNDKLVTIPSERVAKTNQFRCR